LNWGVTLHLRRVTLPGSFIRFHLCAVFEGFKLDTSLGDSLRLAFWHHGGSISRRRGYGTAAYASLEFASHQADQGTGCQKRPKKRSKGSAERGDKEGELLQMSRMDGALRRQQAPIRSEVSVGGERVQATVAHLMTPLRQEVEGAPSVRWWLG
jgi:hypothetical protein